MKVLILSVGRDKTPYYENISTRQLLKIQEILIALGYEVRIEEYGPNCVPEQIASFQPSLVFNFVYGFRSNEGFIEELQHESAKRIESLHPAVLGSDYLTQQVAQDKRETAKHLMGLLEVPAELTATELGRHRFGVAKPRFGACHRGVRLVYTAEEYQALSGGSEEYLLQEYIDGDEYTVGIIGCATGIRVFTPFEVRFNPECVSMPHLMDWDNFRWRFVPRKDAPAGIIRAAITVFEALGMRDYARFDFRFRNGKPVLLDVNSMPNLSPFGSILPYMAEFDRLGYHGLIACLAESITARINPS